MTSPIPKRRWYHPTPASLIYGLLVVEGLLWLSERYRWFCFNECKGWTVLIAVAVVGMAMLVILGWFAASLLFRLRFQFSIRSLLVLVVVVALPFSWLAADMKKVRDQHTMIRRLGGKAPQVVDYAGPPEPAWLRKLLGKEFFTDVTWLIFHDGKIQDSDLTGLAEFDRLDILQLESQPITGAGLKHLNGLSQLRELSLTDTQISDAGLEPIGGMTGLRRLWLNHTHVTDGGVKHLNGLAELKELWLVDTPVTDPGVKKLQQALPNCRIER
jgi:hypothetical protein